MKIVLTFSTYKNVDDVYFQLNRVLEPDNMITFMRKKGHLPDEPTMVHVGFSLPYQASRESIQQMTSVIETKGLMSRTTAPKVILPGDTEWKSKYDLL